MSLILGDLLLKNNYDNKITEIQGKISSIAGWVTSNTVLNAVKNAMPTTDGMNNKTKSNNLHINWS